MEPDPAAVAFWRSEVSNVLEDNVRTHAARHCHLIAREIGIDKVLETVDELLSLEVCDAVLHALAVSLGENEFADSKKAYCVLIWMLENPIRVIRSAALQSILKHAKKGRPLVMYPGLIDFSRFESCNGYIDASDPQQQFMCSENGDILLIPLMCELNKFKGFFQRVSVCELLSSSAETGLSTQVEQEIVVRLARDQVPQVRLAAAQNLGPLSQTYGNFDPIAAKRTVPLQLMRDLMVDPDDLVQAKAIETCLARLLNESPSSDDLVNFIKENLVHSPSWRARMALSKQLDVILDTMKKRGDVGIGSSMDVDSASVSEKADAASAPKGTLRSALLELFTDPEPDVRAEAAKHTHLFASGKDEYINALLEKLVNDEDREVRKAFLSCFAALASLKPSETSQLVNKLVMADQDSEVRSCAVEMFFFGGVLNSIGDREKLEIIRNIYSSSTSSESRSLTVFNWRTKNVAVRAIPIAVQCLLPDTWVTEAGGLFFFQKCLCDPVHTVRRTTLEQVKNMYSAYGADWVKANLASLPEALYSKHQTDYQVRITAIELANELYRINCFSDANAAFIRSAVNDPVPNIVAKIKELFPDLKR